MRSDDPDSTPTQADHEARYRAHEEKRNRLLEEIAAKRLDVERSEPISSKASPAAILEVLEKTLSAVQPALGMMTSTRDMLLADRAGAELRNDTAAADEMSKLLNDFNAQIDEFRSTINQLNATADIVRASMNTDARDASSPNDAG